MSAGRILNTDDDIVLVGSSSMRLSMRMVVRMRTRSVCKRWVCVNTNLYVCARVQSCWKKQSIVTYRRHAYSITAQLAQQLHFCGSFVRRAW